MPRVRVGDVELYYERSGNGEPVLMIMGLATDRTAWAAQVPAFSERYHCVVYDHRGVGLSDAPSPPYSIATFAGDAAGLLDALGLARVHVVGTSMGGAVAMELALRHPARVASLSLHATWARTDAYLRRVMQIRKTLLRTAGLLTSHQLIFLFAYTRPYFNAHAAEMQRAQQQILAYMRAAPLEPYLGHIDAAIEHDCLERLGEIQVPTQVVVGREDILTPPSLAREIVERIPGSTLVEVDGLGHGMFLEAPEAFNRVTFEHLARQDGGLERIVWQGDR